MVRNAREIVAKSLGVSRDEIYFTSGGTEANNLAIAGYLLQIQGRKAHYHDKD